MYVYVPRYQNSVTHGINMTVGCFDAPAPHISSHHIVFASPLSAFFISNFSAIIGMFVFCQRFNDVFVITGNNYVNVTRGNYIVRSADTSLLKITVACLFNFL